MTTSADSINQNVRTFQSSTGALSKQFIESNPSGNGDITSILKTLPNVQFDNTQLKSATPGEIEPANISISGGLFYQNNFQLDGFNMNNDLDPVSSGTTQDYNFNKGGSQGLNIDTSLLDSIIVQDSNVSAAYGSFTGGVIEANTRRPAKRFGANISYQITQGNANGFSLTHYYVDESSINTLLQSSPESYQPEFIKHLIRSSIESKINDNLGVIASFTTTQSFIPLEAYSNPAAVSDTQRKMQMRQSYNVFIKGYYDIGESLRLEASYAYAPQYNTYFLRNTKDSNFYMLSGGHQGGLKATWQNDLGVLNIQSGFNILDSSRGGSALNKRNWFYSPGDKNWNPSGISLTNYNGEGGFGNYTNRQNSFNFKITQDFESIDWKIWENRFLAGLELGYVNAFYERYEDTLFGNQGNLQPLKAGETCGNDTYWCSSSPVSASGTIGRADWTNNIGQYFNQIVLYKAGKINLNNFTTGAFIEDSMRFDLKTFGNLNVRLGLRLDYDTYMNKANFAPRISLNYQSPHNTLEKGKNFASAITFGFNRYYGRNLFAYGLADGLSALRYNHNRTGINAAWTTTQLRNDTDFRQINVPYADEIMIGVSQKIFDFRLEAKYIHRFGKDEIKRVCMDAQGNIVNQCVASQLNSPNRYRFTNDGTSQTDVVTISLQHDKPLEFFGVKNFVLFGFDWTNVKRDYADYSTSLSSDIANDVVSFNGQIMSFADLPANNFVKPYTIRLTTTHTFEYGRTKYLYNNFFRYRSSYEPIAQLLGPLQDSYNGERVPTFRPFHIDGSFTWDIRLGFEVEVWRKNTLYVNLDIFNVLDSKILSVNSNLSNLTNASATLLPVYELGRQFWLQLGYKF